MKECTAVRLTPALVALCHGRRECIVTAAPSLLAAGPCTGLHVYLKLVFACVHSNVFLPKYITKVEEEEVLEEVEEEVARSVPPSQMSAPPVGGMPSSRPRGMVVEVVPREEVQQEEALLWRLLVGGVQIWHTIEVGMWQKRNASLGFILSENGGC